MYSVVLATVLTAGTAQPGWWLKGCHGCHGCHGCYSCYGCYGCYGCCGGCYGCGGYWNVYSACYGCYGCCGGCCGGFGYGYGYSACYGCYGCGGCCGGFTAPAPAERVKPPEKAAAARGPATVVVNAPADAELWVDGQKIPAGTRTFVTPPLDAGRRYYYTLKAQSGKSEREQRVIVEAGQTAQVAFNDLATPAAPAAAVVSAPQAAPAQLRVKLPAEAKLFIDGQQVPLTTAVRSFATPRLEPGRSYFYMIKAELVRDGQTVSDEKRVVVEAGKQIDVSFEALGQVKTATASR